MIKYWLRNSRDASWTTLANAVEKMGGHDNLAQKLRGYARHMQQAMDIARPTFGIPFCDAVTRIVLILGKMEHGNRKSTLRSQN